MPRVWREDPSIECVLAGSAMAAEIKGRTPGIVLLDAASDLATVFERVRQELDITVRQYPVTFDTNDAC